MDKGQEDSLSMYETTSTVLHNYEAVWTGNVPFENNVDELDGQIEKINDLADQQDDDSKGATQDKALKRTTLEQQTFSVASIVAHYAADTGNRTLFENVNVGERDLIRARDNALPTIAEGIINNAENNLVAAAPYGLTQAKIDALTDARTAYVNALSEPRTIIVETSAATEQLPPAFKATNTLLEEKLDSGMELYRYSHTDFYTQYHHARNIVSSPTNKRALEMHFVNNMNGEVIVKVKVEINKGVVIRKSSKLGNIRVQNLVEGSHTYKATLFGFEEVKGSFNVISGETTKLEVKMMPAVATAYVQQTSLYLSKKFQAMKSVSLFLLLILMLLHHVSFSWHIVSSEISYRHVSSNTYEVTLTVYKDCSSTTGFDDPAVIGLFRSDNVLHSTINIGFAGLLTITNAGNLCSEFPNTYCLQKAVYTKTFQLPFLTGGYYLTYQRCCRNSSISNIENPEETGQTAWCAISEAALNFQNKSPVFNTYPIPVVCLNQVYSFDAGATDTDGDSIVYSLCAPNAGADPDEPMPQPPPSGPYENVVFSAPHTFDHPFTPLSLISVDSETGWFQVNPAFIGVYLVGICAQEYRNGTLIGSYTRDFEITVGEFAVGIENYNANDLIAFPNPTNSTLHVSIPSQQHIQQVTVYDAEGRIAKEIVSSGNQNTLDVEVIDLSEGLYFIRIATDDLQYLVKFVKGD